jgi:hypothetical protein
MPMPPSVQPVPPLEYLPEDLHDLADRVTRLRDQAIEAEDVYQASKQATTRARDLDVRLGAEAALKGNGGYKATNEKKAQTTQDQRRGERDSLSLAKEAAEKELSDALFNRADELVGIAQGRAATAGKAAADAADAYLKSRPAYLHACRQLHDALLLNAELKARRANKPFSTGDVTLPPDASRVNLGRHEVPIPDFVATIHADVTRHALPDAPKGRVTLPADETGAVFSVTV